MDIIADDITKINYEKTVNNLKTMDDIKNSNYSVLDNPSGEIDDNNT